MISSKEVKLTKIRKRKNGELEKITARKHKQQKLMTKKGSRVSD
jgi:hypothetical protein